MDHPENKEQSRESVFRATLNLPRTDFPLRPDATKNDAELIERWMKDELFKRSSEYNEGKQTFVLHDGPPYANGPIHLGHAYNKILKDIIAKAQRMEGRHVPLIPGWDCHGLPIELKVAAEHQGVTPLQLIQACREYAAQWIDHQRASFKKLGVLMDWERPYITMQPKYEAAVLRAFARFVEKGFIQKKLKTVAWCPTDQTVLATAEIEYADRKDPSIYVQFPASDELARLCSVSSSASLYFLVWTTTPWTLPLNRAVLYKPDTEYSVLKRDGTTYYIVASERAAALCKIFEIPLIVHSVISSTQFFNQWAQHPFIDSLTIPLLPDPFVSLEDGTALVHCAPGCGPQDYDVGIKHGLEIYSPITPDGRYTDAITPASLAGVSVADGQGKVIQILAEHGRLAFKTSLTHSYPHCWRCRNGLIFRATAQWFCSLTHNELKDRALQSIEEIKFYPPRSSHFLKASIENRIEWCISRQRVWGVPIPALLCKHCDYAYISSEFIDQIAQKVAEQGIEYWHKVSVDELMSRAVTCPECGPGAHFKKEMDILDVWFDSGVSHFAAAEFDERLKFPADLYLEGVDQHRGWFQSSLLTAIAIKGDIPTKAFLTHGFTVDEKGHKMSKSLGNVVNPDDIIKSLGTDGLRLWVASIDYRDDAVVSPVLLQNVAQVYRKIRNTCRFLLSNLYDFDVARDAVPLRELTLLDKYALSSLALFNQNVRSAYAAYDITAIFHALGDYTSVDLSSLYCDMVKDRLYVLHANDPRRRSVQTVFWYLLDTLTKLMAPVLSFTAEIVADHYQPLQHSSIHLQEFNHLHDVVAALCDMDEMTFLTSMVYPNGPNPLRVEPTLSAQISLADWHAEWQFLLQVRTALLKTIEAQRAIGVIKASLESSLLVSFALGDENNKQLFDRVVARLGGLPSFADFLKEFLIVSSVVFSAPSSSLAATCLGGLTATATRVEGVKCPRCWHYVTELKTTGVCERCSNVINQ